MGRYRGQLTAEQAAKGMKAAGVNARALIADAELLAGESRWARAASLGILAIEEGGKQSLLRGLVLSASDDEARREWRDFGRHTEKNFMGAFREFVRPGAKLDDLLPLMADTEGRRNLDTMKQIGFYVECYGPERWVIPGDVVEEELARALIATAWGVVGKQDGAITSVAELHLWVKHLRPVWRGPLDAMKRAVAACYEEAAATGVLRGSGSATEMIDFLGIHGPH